MFEGVKFNQTWMTRIKTEYWMYQWHSTREWKKIIIKFHLQIMILFNFCWTIDTKKMLLFIVNQKLKTFNGWSGFLWNSIHKMEKNNTIFKSNSFNQWWNVVVNENDIFLVFLIVMGNMKYEIVSFIDWNWCFGWSTTSMYA